MKRNILLIACLILMIMFIPITKAQEQFIVENIELIDISEGVNVNSEESVDVLFNDLTQTASYQATIQNTTSESLYINYIEVDNSSEEFINYSLDDDSLNKVIEPNSSTTVNFTIETLEEDGAGRNLSDEVQINFVISNKIYNPPTSRTFTVLIIFAIILFVVISINKTMKIKKKSFMFLMLLLTSLVVTQVYADEQYYATTTGKVTYESQNVIMATGTVLNDKSADYTNSKEVWAYYDQVKNVEVLSNIKTPKKYYKKFDLSEKQDNRVQAYLIENGDSNVPYDLKIMSKGVFVANQDSSFLFSFPNSEKVEGLSNVDFREATTMQGMFIGNTKLENVDAAAIEMDNTKDTSYMFYNCDNITNTSDEFKTENVEVKDYMIPQVLHATVKKDAVDDTNEMLNGKNITTGKYLKNETTNDNFPIYYYRGDIQDNNVAFAGFCWKIVRTTETGGTKLIYNGIVNEDGSCTTASDDDNNIGWNTFNHGYSSLNAIGYMKGTTDIYERNNSFGNTYRISTNSNYTVNSEHYYAKEYTYENGKYYLSNPQKYKWADSYNEINGTYRCGWSSTSCASLSYVIGSSSSTLYEISLKNGEAIEDKYIYISKNYTQQEAEYTLQNPIKKSFVEWISEYESFVGYYMCTTGTDTTCSTIMKIAPSSQYSITGVELEQNIYGSGVTYKDGVYTLEDVFVSESWYDDKEKILKNYQYTCNGEYSCTEVGYIINASNSSYSYLELSNGLLFEDVYQDIFESNSIDSGVKEFIDSWYENNMTDYTNYLEDTVWCNDRSFYSGGIKSQSTENLEIQSSTSYRYENNIIQLSCPNKSDSFTVSTKNGNGKLTYPVALLTVDELMLGGMDNENNIDTYLDSYGYGYWSMSTFYWGSTAGYFGSRNRISNEDIDAGYMIRPSISLKNSIKYVSGDGTVTSPYIIE